MRIRSLAVALFTLCLIATGCSGKKTGIVGDQGLEEDPGRGRVEVEEEVKVEEAAVMELEGSVSTLVSAAGCTDQNAYSCVGGVDANRLAGVIWNLGEADDALSRAWDLAATVTEGRECAELLYRPISTRIRIHLPGEQLYDADGEPRVRSDSAPIRRNLCGVTYENEYYGRDGADSGGSFLVYLHLGFDCSAHGNAVLIEDHRWRFGPPGESPLITNNEGELVSGCQVQEDTFSLLSLSGEVLSGTRISEANFSGDCSENIRQKCSSRVAMDLTNQPATEPQIPPQTEPPDSEQMLPPSPPDPEAPVPVTETPVGEWEPGGSREVVSEEEAESPTVIFADANLAAKVRRTLGLASDALITETDLLRLTSLTADAAGITNLGGLEHATHLAVLSIKENMISDLSPLAELRSLKTLAASYNQIVDLNSLVNLTWLKTIDLSHNLIEDISPLRILYDNGDPSPLVSIDLRSNRAAYDKTWQERINEEVRDYLGRAGVTVLMD